MTALPASIAFTGGSVTEGAYKTAVTDQRDYLAGLLGADGVPATALTALNAMSREFPIVTGNAIEWSTLTNFFMAKDIGSGFPGIQFDTGDGLDYDRASNVLRAFIAGVEAMRIDASGRMGVNNNAPSSSARLVASESTSAIPAVMGIQGGTGSSAVRGHATNESFANTVIYASANRSANSAFGFLFADSDANGTPDTEFILRGDGTALADGSFTGSGADYQEYFHSLDGTALAVGGTVVLDGDRVRPATDKDPVDLIMGVVRPKEDNKNSAVVGNAAWNHWTDKYLTDEFGRYEQETYRVLSWLETIPAVTVTVQKQKTETRTVRRQETVVINDRAELRVVTSDVVEPVYETFPMFDDKGVAVMVEESVYVDGVPLTTDVAVVDDQGRPGVRKEVVKRRTQAVHKQPVMETLTIPVRPATSVRREYAEDKMPPNVTPPADAQVQTFTRRKLNPAFVDGGYTPRHERPEWNLIGLLGQVQIANSAPVNPRWVRMKTISETVSLWFVR